MFDKVSCPFMFRWCALAQLCSLVLASAKYEAASRLDASLTSPAEDGSRLMRRDSVVVQHDHRRMSQPASDEDVPMEPDPTPSPDMKATMKAHDEETHNCDPATGVCTQTSKASTAEPIVTINEIKESSATDQTFTAACPSGYTVIGGGCLARLATEKIDHMKDSSANGWKCVSEEKNDDMTKEVLAVCALSCKSLQGDPNMCDDAGMGDNIDDTHHICAEDPCTPQECCKPAKTCASFLGTCDQHEAKKDDSTKCTTTDCQDCCAVKQTCGMFLMEHGGTCGPDLTGKCTVPIPDGSKPCSGVECPESDCCEAAPTCSEFSGEACGKDFTKKDDSTPCCSGTCTCGDCFQ